MFFDFLLVIIIRCMFDALYDYFIFFDKDTIIILFFSSFYIFPCKILKSFETDKKCFKRKLWCSWIQLASLLAIVSWISFVVAFSEE